MEFEEDWENEEVDEDTAGGLIKNYLKILKKEVPNLYFYNYSANKNLRLDLIKLFEQTREHTYSKQQTLSKQQLYQNNKLYSNNKLIKNQDEVPKKLC